ncbi:helix-turn-helix domain-containing protein [Streptomyces auratus]|uniref:AraC family transcriptional regulator n=1 Tax=Streptomyces auratus AGR0001 TaxID=1160718 RepID=J2JQB7_9ACTN|nr:helix-turn-helix domain-containing protein [Streptomyces auratus]
MLLTVFDSVVVPAADRVEAWTELTATALMPTRIRFVGPGDFGARIRSMPFGAAHLSALSYSPLLSERTPQLIRQSDPELYQLALVTSGRQGVEQARNNVLLEAGSMVLYDSSRPFSASVHAGVGRADSLVFQFPKRLLPLPAHRIGRLLAVPLPADNAMSRLLAQFLTGAAEAHATYAPFGLVQLGGIGIDLVTAVLSHHLDGTPAAASATRPGLLFLRISSFIEEHLSYPLSPAEIASAHQISLRYLQRIFQEQGTTVSAFVRGRRISHCCKDLADPAKQEVPVHAIGARWGFPRPDDFSRVFRKAVGMPPGKYRATHTTVDQPA